MKLTNLSYRRTEKMFFNIVEAAKISSHLSQLTASVQHYVAHNISCDSGRLLFAQNTKIDWIHPIPFDVVSANERPRGEETKVPISMLHYWISWIWKRAERYFMFCCNSSKIIHSIRWIRNQRFSSPSIHSTTAQQSSSVTLWGRRAENTLKCDTLSSSHIIRVIYVKNENGIMMMTREECFDVFPSKLWVKSLVR